MYQTHLHRIGKDGSYDHKGRLWETGGGFLAWEVIYHGRSKKQAVTIAIAAECHAVVTEAHMSYALFDNGKEPGRRERPYEGPLLPTCP